MPAKKKEAFMKAVADAGCGDDQEACDKMFEAGVTADTLEEGKKVGLSVADFFFLFQKYGQTFLEFFQDLSAILSKKASQAQDGIASVNTEAHHSEIQAAAERGSAGLRPRIDSVHGKSLRQG